MPATSGELITSLNSHGRTLVRDRMKSDRSPRSMINSSPRYDLPHGGGILSDLIAKLLVHSHNRRIPGLEVGKSLLEAAPDLGGTSDPSSSRKELVRQARLRRRLDRLEHPGRVGRQVNLAERQVGAQDRPVFLLCSRQKVEGAHIIINIPALLL